MGPSWLAVLKQTSYLRVTRVHASRSKKEQIIGRSKESVGDCWPDESSSDRTVGLGLMTGTCRRGAFEISAAASRHRRDRRSPNDRPPQLSVIDLFDP